MASGESGLKTRIMEIVRTTKAQKEPMTAGSEYQDTKRVIQNYEEQYKYLKKKLEDAKAELVACNALPRKCAVVGAGYTVKGYGLLIPMRDDYDIVKELEMAAKSLKETYGLANYLENPEHHGKIVLYPYPVTELSLFFPEFATYDLFREFENMVRSFRAAYGLQVNAAGMRSVEEAIKWEANASMIVGNAELAERLKESDTTLLISLAAGAQGDEETAKPSKLPKEPSMAEVEEALQAIAATDLDIKAPSSIAGPSPIEQTDTLTGVDVVNMKGPKKKIKRKEKPRTAKPKATA